MTSNTPQYPVSSARHFLRLPDVMRLVGLGRSAIYAKVKAGEFPSPVSLGARAVAWLSDEIVAWIEARVVASRSLQNQGGAK